MNRSSDSYLVEIPFIRPPLENVISRSLNETIFGNKSGKSLPY